jgi:hypothetical protein
MGLLDKHPDLRAGMDYELARADRRHCRSNCEKNAIQRRWLDKARAREVPPGKARRDWRGSGLKSRR